jgi:ribosomal protein S18 acetylase RimI-like enzyme
MEVEIREYRPEDEEEWMRVHAVILSISHSWNYSIQERPDYKGFESTRLVALDGGKIVGLIDTQFDNEPGEICLLDGSRGGYVTEFGRLPEHAHLGLGPKLMDAAKKAAEAKGFSRLEYWSQDRKAQRFYGRLGLKEIGRHYRFRFKPPKEVDALLLKDCVGVEYMYGACVPEEWPLVKKKYEVIQKHPLEPHLCIGYEVRF